MQGSQLPPAAIGEEMVKLRVSRKRGSKPKTEKADMWSFNCQLPHKSKFHFSFRTFCWKSFVRFPMPPQLASNSIFERLCTVLDTATYSMKVSMKAGIALSFYGPRPQPDYSVGFGRSAFTDDQLEKLKPFVGEVTDTFTSYFMAIRGRTRHQNMFIGLHKNLLG